ncbi:MAG: SRPBCC family protein [Rhodovulum sp.]
MNIPVIDRTAPVCARAQEVIFASRERVWDVLTDFRRWPAWNPAFRRVVLHGALAEGACVTWTTSHGMTFQTQVASLDRYNYIGWLGSTAAMRAAYMLTLASDPGRTCASLEASVESGLARLMPQFTQRALHASLARGLAALRRETQRCAQ